MGLTAILLQALDEAATRLIQAGNYAKDEVDARRLEVSVCVGECVCVGVTRSFII